MHSRLKTQRTRAVASSAARRTPRRGVRALAACGVIAALGCAGSHENERPAATPATEPDYNQQAAYEANPAAATQGSESTRGDERAAGVDPATPQGGEQRGEHSGAGQADTTAVNERDRDDSSVTPMDQSNDPADVELVSAIRQQVIADDSLSFTGKNVKIIANDGNVTLRGPVYSAAEKQRIGAYAKRHAKGRVINQLDVQQQ